MDCPRCGAALGAMTTEAGPTVDFCASCGGTWFDAGELESALAEPRRLALGLAEPVDEAGPSCPRCALPMRVVKWPPDQPIELDICLRCRGVWLDRGELGEVRKIVARFPRAAMFVRVQPEGSDVVAEVPLSTRRRARLRPAWLVGGCLFMLAGLAAVSGLLQGFVWVVGTGDATMSTTVLAAGSLLGLGVGGFVIGWRSAGFTIVEPAIAAVPALLAWQLMLGGALSAGLAAALVVGGMLLAVVGAALGEQFEGW